MMEPSGLRAEDVVRKAEVLNEVVETAEVKEGVATIRAAAHKATTKNLLYF